MLTAQPSTKSYIKLHYESFNQSFYAVRKFVTFFIKGLNNMKYNEQVD